MKKIALFGGSFNPVHNGHIRIADIAADTLGLDRVIFIPTYIQPFKQNEKSESGKARLDMLYLATENDKRFEVSDYEIKKGGISYSYQTAEYYKAAYPDSTLYFIMGDDSYAQLNTWKNVDRLSACVQFVVFPRRGNRQEGNATFIDTPPMEVSSTEIRNKIMRGEDVSGLMPRGVLEYIKKNKLYE